MAPPTKAAIDRLVDVVSDLSLKISDMQLKLNDCFTIISKQKSYIDESDKKVDLILNKLEILLQKETDDKKALQQSITRKNKNKNKKQKDKNSPDTSRKVPALFSTITAAKIPRFCVTQSPSTLDDSGPQALTIIDTVNTTPRHSILGPVNTTPRHKSPGICQPRPAAESESSSHTGTPETRCLRAAPPRTVSLHLFNFSVGTSPDDITNHLKSRLHMTACCEKLTTRGEYSSFRLDVPAAKVQSVRDPKLWPEGVAVRKFNVVTSKNGKKQHNKNPTQT